tara:strand:- start:467 stop:631 length:165 start_codon:yes stop_codon:yes gene_type:complete
MYLNDFDDNGQQDPILTYNKKGVEFILVSKKDLSKQLLGIKRNVWITRRTQKPL